MYVTLDLDPNWAKIHDPDPNSMYLDPRTELVKPKGRLVGT